MSRHGPRSYVIREGSSGLVGRAIMGGMRKLWVIVWLVLVAAQLAILYTPDLGEGPGILAPLWDVLRPLPGPTAMGEPGFDKIVHGLSFGAIAAAGMLAGWPTWLALALPAIHAPVSELIQWRWIDGRAGDWRDLLADWTGILLAWVLVTAWKAWRGSRPRATRRGRRQDDPRGRPRSPRRGSRPARTPDPGIADPGITDPGITDPGTADPGITDPRNV